MNSFNSRKKLAGFTMIELMSAVAIIGILAAIAYPKMEDYMRTSRRADGMALLSQVMAAQERFYVNNSYEYTAALGQLGLVAEGGQFLSDDEYYHVTAASCGSNGDRIICINLSAIPRGVQLGDGTMQLNNRSMRCVVGDSHGSNGWGDASNCDTGG